MDKNVYLNWLKERQTNSDEQINEIAPLVAAAAPIVARVAAPVIAGGIAKTVAPKIASAAGRRLATTAIQVGTRLAADKAADIIVNNTNNTKKPVSENNLTLMGGSKPKPKPAPSEAEELGEVDVSPLASKKPIKEVAQVILPILGRLAVGYAMSKMMGGGGTGDDDDNPSSIGSQRDIPTGQDAGGTLPAVALQSKSNITNTTTKPTSQIDPEKNPEHPQTRRGGAAQLRPVGFNEERALNKKVNKHVSKFLKSREGNALKGEVKEILKTS